MIELTQLAASLLMATLAVFVYRGGPRNPANQAFSAHCLSIAGWAMGLAGLQHSVGNLDLWFGFVFAFASLVPVTFTAFSHYFPAARSWSLPWFAWVISSTGVLFSMLSLTTELIVYGTEIGPTGLTRKAGPLYPLFALYFLSSWCVGFWVFVTKWRSARGLVRAQFHYLGAGVICGSTGAICTNLIIPLLTGRSSYSWLGPYFSLVYVGFVAHAIIRHRLMDLRLFIHRGLTIALAIFLSAAPVALLLALFWPRLLTHLEASELALLLIAAAVATILVPITRDVSGRLLDRYVYRTHANYRRTVREASRMLTRVLRLDPLLNFIGSTISRSTAVEGVAVYLRESSGYRCAVWMRQVEGFHAPMCAPKEIVRALAAAQEPLLTDEVARQSTMASAEVHRHLDQVNWSLVLPVVSADGLIAMIAVGPKLSGDAFYQQDLDLLMTLANQAGVAIKNAQLYTAVVVANEYLENIAATIESGVVAVDAGARVAMLNRAAERLTGLPRTILGEAATALPACLEQPLLATVADGQARTQPEVELPTAKPEPDGPASRPVICTVSPVRDPGGAVLGAVAVFSDLTPLKELELERRRAERLAYLQALASAIAHEIKNPLVAIKTFTQLLPRRQGDARFLDELGRIATREMERIQRLVDRLRTLSRPAGAPQHPVDVRVPLGDAIELVQPMLQEGGKRLVATPGSEPCVVMGNPLELEQLFLNLLLNAHEATPVGGTVAVEIARADRQFTVSVADSGPGVPPELQERIFEPFFTTKARGSGLGLAISAGIAQAHGARLRATNRPGTGGAIFTVEFPAAPVVSAVVA